MPRQECNWEIRNSRIAIQRLLFNQEIENLGADQSETGILEDVIIER